MNPSDPINSDNREQPYSPAPIVGSSSWRERFDIKLWLPRIIVAAILVHILPYVVSLLYPPLESIVFIIRDWLSVVIIILFVIIIIIQLTSPKGPYNAKNRS